MQRCGNHRPGLVHLGHITFFFFQISYVYFFVYLLTICLSYLLEIKDHRSYLSYPAVYLHHLS